MVSKRTRFELFHFSSTMYNSKIQERF
uniref:Uncharacterized protein n=1 Tax=Arundo donax TaxID=35708 RepID=A0A0A9AZW0_ARUDO